MTGPRIQAIETEAYGCRFRSRLEARWAVFFTGARFRWQYEPEGFETPHGRYLPDFRLDTGMGPFWVEVKPVSDTVDDPRWADVAAGSGLMLLCLRGMHRDGDLCGADHRVRAVVPTGAWFDIHTLWREPKYDRAWSAASSARFERGGIVFPPGKGRR